MSISIGEYEFEGPYKSIENLKNNSGVYAIICKVGEEYYLIDVGESKEVKYRVENHDRAECWQKNCTSELMVAVLYTPNKQKHGRMEIEQKIRNEYDLPCGDI